MDLKEEYDTAKELLFHLRELSRLRAAISEMNRSLISEIHKYPTPPKQVHQVMTATFIMLGEAPKKMKVKTKLQYLYREGTFHGSISKLVLTDIRLPQNYT